MSDGDGGEPHVRVEPRSNIQAQTRCVLQPNGLDDLGNTALLSLVMGRVSDPALVHGSLGADFLLRLLELLSLLDPRVADRLWPVGGEPTVLQDRSGQRSRTVGGFWSRQSITWVSLVSKVCLIREFSDTYRSAALAASYSAFFFSFFSFADLSMSE